MEAGTATVPRAPTDPLVVAMAELTPPRQLRCRHPSNSIAGVGVGVVKLHHHGAQLVLECGSWT